MTLTTQDGPAQVAATGHQLLALRTASESLVEICRTMFFIELEQPDEVVMLPAEEFTFAGCVTLIHDGGSWELGLYGDDRACNSLARAILGMEADEVPAPAEIVDALGEIVNMVGGSVKTHLAPLATGEIHTSSPAFFLGAECGKHQPTAIPVLARRFSSPEIEGDIYFAWSERGPEALVSEIGAMLDPSALEDKLRLVQALSVLQELDHVLPPCRADIHEALAACATVLSDVVNDQARDAEVAVEVIACAVAAIPAALESGEGALALGAIVDYQISAAGGTAALAKVERDEETIEMIGDFIQESEDGLERVDAILIEAETGALGSESIDELFRTYHTIKGVASFLDLGEIQKLSHTTESLMDKVRQGEYSLAGQVLDLVFESTEALRTQLGYIREAAEAHSAVAPYAAQALLIESLEAATAGKTVDVAKLKRATSEPEADTEAIPAPARAKLRETLKIDLELVDELDAVSCEMRAFAKLVKDSPDELEALPEELRSAVLGLSNSSVRLREVGARIRMVSVGKLFQKMTRMVRDLSKKTEKLTKVVLVGEDTMVPRGAVDGLNDPLVHMVRNAVDHGIEDQEQRAASGKPLLATITLSAVNEGDRVVVEIAEDGQGLDRERLLAKGLEKGLVEQGAELSDGEVFNLIFAAGFSTAAQVTAISGRGVGMDVVRRGIESLGGHIDIESELGLGTTFRIVLPISDGEG